MKKERARRRKKRTSSEILQGLHQNDIRVEWARSGTHVCHLSVQTVKKFENLTRDKLRSPYLHENIFLDFYLLNFFLLFPASLGIAFQMDGNQFAIPSGGLSYIQENLKISGKILSNIMILRPIE